MKYNKLLLVLTFTLMQCSSAPSGGIYDFVEPALPPAPQSEILGPGSGKNIIIMINDGTSYGAWDMTTYWEFGTSVKETEPYRSMDVKLGMSTFPLNFESVANYDSTLIGSYDPEKAWSEKPSGNENLPFEGYVYLSKNYTDSAAGGTQLSTGVKSYNSSINVDNFEEPLEFITQIAKRAGKRTGVVTSVEFSHATPATFGANNLSRQNYTDIAHQMLHNGDLDLIMGGGHPFFSPNGRNLGGPVYNRVSYQDWEDLSKGKLTPKGFDEPWTLIETKEDFQALAQGNLSVQGPLAGVAQIRYTLQHGRTKSALGEDPKNPSKIRFVPSVPTLAEMTQGALNYLSQGDEGFFLMIEGGATDWAAHGNQLEQLIEESLSFHHSFQTVVNWVEENSNWEETLLIVTTDHGNAMPLGPDSHKIPFQPVENRGQGNLPGVRFYVGSHTNELGLLWAKGAGAKEFEKHIRGYDPGLARHTGHNERGAYVDATDVFTVMRKSVAEVGDTINREEK